MIALLVFALSLQSRCKNRANPPEPGFEAWHTTCKKEKICDACHTDRTATLDGSTDRCYTNPMTIMHLSLAELANMNDDAWIWKDDMMVWPDTEHPIAECFSETNSDDCSDD
jgi:hypothetical protein